MIQIFILNPFIQKKKKIIIDIPKYIVIVKDNVIVENNN